MSNLNCYMMLKAEIQRQVDSFKTLARYNAILDPFILVQNIEMILERSEDRVQASFHSNFNYDDIKIKVEDSAQIDPTVESEHQLIQSQKINAKMKNRVRMNQVRRKLCQQPLKRLETASKKTKGTLKCLKGRALKNGKGRRTRIGMNKDSNERTRLSLPEVDNSTPNALTIEKMHAADEFIEQWTEKLANGGRQKFKCLICGKSNLPFRYNARIHVRRVHLKDRLPCPKCPKDFYNSKLLRVHLEKCDGRGRTKLSFNANDHWRDFKTVLVTNPFPHFNLQRTLMVQVLLERIDDLKLVNIKSENNLLSDLNSTSIDVEQLAESLPNTHHHDILDFVVTGKENENDVTLFIPQVERTLNMMEF